MGRLDTNASQYHQGLQFQELNQTHTQAAETIEDAPPHDESQDLYEPPPNAYQKPQQIQQSEAVMHNVKPRGQVPQAFPPPQHVDPVVSFPPPAAQTNNNQYNFVQQQNMQPANNIGMQFPQQQPAFGQPVGVSPSPMMPQLQNQLPSQAWRTDLFGCMNDPQNAIITLFFPCVTFGQIAEILDSGTSTCATSGMWYSLIAVCIGMPFIMSCTYRSKIRSRFGLIESPAPDWLVHCFCEHCALCQEYRELQLRGIDPTIGWAGNVAKQHQRQQFGMTPPMQQRMM